MFSFGDAKFYGSTGGQPLVAPITTIVPTTIRPRLLARRRRTVTCSRSVTRVFFGSTGGAGTEFDRSSAPPRADTPDATDALRSPALTAGSGCRVTTDRVRSGRTGRGERDARHGLQRWFQQGEGAEARVDDLDGAVTPTRQVALQAVLAPREGERHARIRRGLGEHPPVDRRQAAASRSTRTQVDGTGGPVAGRGLERRARGGAGHRRAAGRSRDPLHGRGRARRAERGALLTIAVIALMRGDQLEPDLTMTGSINPDGTIGPCESATLGRGRAHARVVIPGSATRRRSGKSSTSSRPGPARCREAGNIYDAYQLFTGKTLRTAGSTTPLNQSVYEKLHAKVETWTADVPVGPERFPEPQPVGAAEISTRTRRSAIRQMQEAQKLTTRGTRCRRVLGRRERGRRDARRSRRLDSRSRCC